MGTTEIVDPGWPKQSLGNRLQHGLAAATQLHCFAKAEASLPPCSDRPEIEIIPTLVGVLKQVEKFIGEGLLAQEVSMLALCVRQVRTVSMNAEMLAFYGEQGLSLDFTCRLEDYLDAGVLVSRVARALLAMGSDDLSREAQRIVTRLEAFHHRTKEVA